MKKRIADLTPEEQEKVRAYNRESKRRSRENERAEQTPSHDEWTWKWGENFPQHYKELNAYEKAFSAKVQEQLGRERFDPYCLEAETLSWVAVTSYCFRKKDSPWIREVVNPNGIIVGGLFYPDVLGSGLVANTHRFGLERSATYAGLYRELLQTLDKRYGHERTKDATDIRSELVGEYVVDDLLEVKPATLEVQPEPGAHRPAVVVPADESRRASQLLPTMYF